MDDTILKFITENYMAISIAFMALKGVAKITPWAWDDSIISLFFGIFSQIREHNEVKIDAKA